METLYRLSYWGMRAAPDERTQPAPVVGNRLYNAAELIERGPDVGARLALPIGRAPRTAALVGEA